jgi:hypothetical protein
MKGAEAWIAISAEDAQCRRYRAPGGRQDGAGE